MYATRAAQDTATDAVQVCRTLCLRPTMFTDIPGSYLAVEA